MDSLVKDHWAAEAGALFDNGFHCAEAVAWAVLSGLGLDPAEAAAHATAFGGGLGRSFDELCGALAGGVVAVGHVHGRREPTGGWDMAADMAAELRRGFVDAHGTTHCGALRQRFGEDQISECRALVRWTTAALLDLLG